MSSWVATRRAPMPAVGLALGIAGLGLAAYFFGKSRRLAPASEFGGVFEVGVAELFGLFALGAVLHSGIALVLRRRRPLLSDIASVVGLVCGLVPPGLVVAFMFVQRLG